MFTNEDAKKKILVTILRSDGETIVGNLLLPVMADLARSMNNDTKYFEFEDLHGNARLIAKSSIIELQTEVLKKQPELSAAKTDASINPHQVLGLQKDAEWTDIRKAYLKITKLYHPDQYSTVNLPPEVLRYMSDMFSRANTAYNIIKVMQAEKQTA